MSSSRRRRSSRRPALRVALLPHAGVAAALVLAAVQPVASARPGKVTSCGAEGAFRGEVASVNERLELTLADGKVLKITGVDPPGPTPDDPDLDMRSGKKAAAWLVGRQILFRPLIDRPDRWGRIPALAFAPGETAALSIGEALLGGGLARFAPGPGTGSCRASLLHAEARARVARRGLWADSYYAVLSAHDRGAFDERAATNVVVEGEVAAVSEGPFRTNLHFGPRRGYDFSVTILPRNIKLFEAAGLKPSDLKGRRLRVRGLLDVRFGPQIEISSPDEVEIITDDKNEPAP